MAVRDAQEPGETLPPPAMKPPQLTTVYE